MKHGKLDKIFEEQEKLIKVKLSSDPVKKDKSYEGYLVNETPKAESLYWLKIKEELKI